MTIEQVWQDINTDRVKKVVFDGDFAAEVDDQYAMAYALGSDKMEVLAVIASATYNNYDVIDTEEMMLKGYDEMIRTLDAVGLNDGSVPALKGATSQITHNKDLAPSDSEGARKIIELAKASDELIYVFCTGPCTNVVSALMMDPSITDKICVVWLGGVCLEEQRFHEWNLYSDYAAAQLLMNLNVNVVMLPCDPIGSVKILMSKSELNNAFPGDSKAEKFFTDYLPCIVYNEERRAGEWVKVMCDYASPATIAIPDSMEFSIIPAPVITDNENYAFDKTRKKILYGINPDSKRITDDALESIKKLVKRM